MFELLEQQLLGGGMCVSCPLSVNPGCCSLAILDAGFLSTLVCVCVCVGGEIRQNDSCWRP